MIEPIWFNRFTLFYLLPVLSIFISSCAFYDLKKEGTEFEKTYALTGKVTTHSSHKEPVIVILYSEKKGKKEIVKYTLPEDNDYYSFLMTKGTYYLAAFEDLNNNLSYDKEELAGFFGAPDKIILPSKKMLSSGSKALRDLDIQLTKNNLILYDFPAAVNVEAISGTAIVKFGHVTDLEDKIFAQENGTTGYWKPLTFLKDFGFGIYFIERYDADKIPILFVHGATGTPKGWKMFVQQIDRKKYQPWFYYYPSGFRLNKIARALNYIMKKLHDTYRFNALYVTAHSMGGLVSRSFIMKNVYEDNQDYLKLFVSISTPWNGHRAAAKGAKHAPVVIPSWYDMVPESEFIRSIYYRKLPSNVKFHLFFSFRGDCSLFMKNNDGTVELDSELDYRAQKDAERIIGFDEDHTSILSSQKVIDHYNQILTSVERIRGGSR